MTMRQAILARLKLDLLNMRVGNGYELDFRNTAIKGVPLGEVRNFPTVFYSFGNETNEALADGQQDKTSLQVSISVLIGEYKDTGMLVDMSEQAVSDMRKFIYQDTTSISSDNVLRWDLIHNEGQQGNSVIWEWRIDLINVTYDWDNGKALINFTVNVMYPDFHNEKLSIVA